MARPTVPGPWRIERQEGYSECEESHPVRLGRGPHPAPAWNDHSERADAIRRGRAGYLCPGGELHPYPIWVVHRGDVNANDAEVYEEYLHAVDGCDRRNKEAATDV